MNQIIETLTPDEAYKILKAHGMHTSPETIRRGLEQRVFTFGDCVMCDKSPAFYVYKRKLYEWIAERVAIDEE